MRIAVIVAMEEEIGLLKKSMSNAAVDKVAGININTGTYQGHQLFVAQSGIGKVQAGMVSTILCDHYLPDVLINTGSAAGIGADLSIGDVVISSKVAYHDVDVTSSGYEWGQLPQRPLYFESDKKLIAQIVEAGDIVNQQSHVGLIVSGDQFINGEEQVAQILQHFPEALSVEMEGAAVGQVATQFKVPFVVIRAMSDVGNEEASVSFDEFVRDAGERSVQMLLNFMDNN
ncbi:MAG: 5'-methylthioadenosine/adenosylhomocysteine nucleosidase [Lactobacillus sp.]|uniref:adenosylhomocysteine nucleosidase n=1 Tax=Bombilactobacillus bombi TaxID=1303590 RepID=A0A3R7CKW8_9LACO|nr:5'-methylthioadenosine/adenosylhomocysteine nucleosidase [Bombilactobacillus bombi]MCO6541392.1 5'-methylthioadenosine/adenosylhomocysteine nucleosidase [Lactobacillus sp.]MCO6542795.1 5'-methylthioadenosine/adenosylhomocysteine nucleosidase [Lactobacillus sp.]RHW46891.1 5'-methylthioadenosine/S-adenosylhomocysteine nucleosidase [Bombilactobacillus bombi]